MLSNFFNIFSNRTTAKRWSIYWFVERLRLCIAQKRFPYAYYQVKQLLKRFVNHLMPFQFFYWLSYWKYCGRVGKGAVNVPLYDLVFVIKKKTSGWILEGICREIARYYSGKYAYHYAETNTTLPPAKAYFFSHYSFFPRCLLGTPDIWGSKRLVWFPHPKEMDRTGMRHLTFALNRATLLVCPCSQNLDVLVSRGVKRERLTYILGGADPDLFQPHQRSLGAVGFCTAYYPRKSPDLMLEIVRLMPHRRFILVGPPSTNLKSDHRNWRQYSRFNEFLSLPNFTYVEALYSDYPKYYAQMDVLLSTSQLEGGPIALIEAMMSNVVPVSSRTGFAADIIRHGENGFLFDVDSDASLVCDLVERAYCLETDVRATAEHLSWRNFSLKIQYLLNGYSDERSSAIRC